MEKEINQDSDQLQYLLYKLTCSLVTKYESLKILKKNAHVQYLHLWTVAHLSLAWKSLESNFVKYVVTFMCFNIYQLHQNLLVFVHLSDIKILYYQYYCCNIHKNRFINIKSVITSLYYRLSCLTQEIYDTENMNHKI